MERETSFLGRHTTPARNATETDQQSEQYSDLTEGGVEKAREKAKGEIQELIQNAPEGAVVFLGGASDQPRTKETVKIYGDTLAEMMKNGEIKDAIRVLTQEDIIDMGEGKGPTSTIKQIRRLLEKEDKNTKVVVTFPMKLKGFSYGYNDRWTQDGKKTEYFSEILKKHNGSHEEAGLDWLKNQGILTTEDGRQIEGPKPEQVAKDYLESLERLRTFASEYTDRPLVVGGVGHQWDLDAVVTYLASGKKDVTYDQFTEVANDAEQPIMDEAEMFNFTVEEDTISVNYRGKKWKSKNE